jgi:uncharacterized OB-fold protein
MPDDYWNDYRDHKNDVKIGIVRCGKCAAVMVPDKKKKGRHRCPGCGRQIRSPRWYLEEQGND